jgi:hypothetical protein
MPAEEDLNALEEILEKIFESIEDSDSDDNDF